MFVDGIDRPAMVYTGVTDGPLDSTVCLRWGSEDLDTWSPPVVVTSTPHVDGIREMRDPFVFRRGGRSSGPGSPTAPRRAPLRLRRHPALGVPRGLAVAA
ncbi:MAG: hypothetical protein ACRCSN_08650 [Dermatophilaceae bacterium]